MYLKRHGLKPDKVQDFIPGPMDIATCMYYTGLDPMSGEPVYVARGARERRLQRALLQYFKPENYADVREALERGRPARPGRRRAGVSDSRRVRRRSSRDRRDSRPSTARTRGEQETASRRLSAASENGQDGRKDQRCRRRSIYQLLDFGDGRRLERFGQIMLDRPCPAAEAFERADPDAWQQADARFEGREDEKGAMDRSARAARAMDRLATARCVSS